MADKWMIDKMSMLPEPMTLMDFLDHVADVVGPDAEVMIGKGTTFKWQVEPTAEQIAAREQREREAAARAEEWERRTYAILKAKFEGKQ
jgi:hypothetical protein